MVVCTQDPLARNATKSIHEAAEDGLGQQYNSFEYMRILAEHWRHILPQTGRLADLDVERALGRRKPCRFNGSGQACAGFSLESRSLDL